MTDFERPFADNQMGALDEPRAPVDINPDTMSLTDVEADIHEANVDFAEDIIHHLGWLDSKKAGAGAEWAKDTIAKLAEHLAERQDIDDFISSL